MKRFPLNRLMEISTPTDKAVQVSDVRISKWNEMNVPFRVYLVPRVVRILRLD
jgi:hypothetical protein